MPREHTTCTGDCNWCQWGREDGYALPISHGYSGDGESGRKWWVYSREEYDAYLEGCDEHHDGLHGAGITGAYRFYSGPGRAFGEDACVAILGKYHVLVTQWVGLDI